jgi:hypothetical protein
MPRPHVVRRLTPDLLAWQTRRAPFLADSLGPCLVPGGALRQGEAVRRRAGGRRSPGVSFPGNVSTG